MKQEIKGIMKYLVKWRGYGTNRSTWEPRSYLTNCSEALKNVYDNTETPLPESEAKEFDNNKIPSSFVPIKILNSKILLNEAFSRWEIHYEVKWKGFPFTTFEPKSEIHFSEEVLREYEATKTENPNTQQQTPNGLPKQGNFSPKPVDQGPKIVMGLQNRRQGQTSFGMGLQGIKSVMGYRRGQFQQKPLSMQTKSSLGNRGMQGIRPTIQPNFGLQRRFQGLGNRNFPMQGMKPGLQNRGNFKQKPVCMQGQRLLGLQNQGNSNQQIQQNPANMQGRGFQPRKQPNFGLQRPLHQGKRFGIQNKGSFNQNRRQNSFVPKQRLQQRTQPKFAGQNSRRMLGNGQRQWNNQIGRQQAGSTILGKHSRSGSQLEKDEEPPFKRRKLN
jgi:hypothetical protein